MANLSHCLYSVHAQPFTPSGGLKFNAKPTTFSGPCVFVAPGLRFELPDNGVPEQSPSFSKLFFNRMLSIHKFAFVCCPCNWISSFDIAR